MIEQSQLFNLLQIVIPIILVVLVILIIKEAIKIWKMSKEETKVNLSEQGK